MAVRALPVLARAGLGRLLLPPTAARGVIAAARYGLTPATAYELAAAHAPRRVALVDDHGTLTFAELVARIDDLRRRLPDAGVEPGQRVGLLCPNSRSFPVALAALSALGTDIVLLNTGFAPPAVADVVRTERISAVVVDHTLKDLVGAPARRVRRIVMADGQLLDAPARDRSHAPARVRGTGERDGGHARHAGAADAVTRAPAVRGVESGAGTLGHLWPFRAGLSHRSRYVLLTSGTTGRPRGAPRDTPATLEPLVAFLSRLPMREGDTTLIASPLFHAWGFVNLAIGMLLSSTVVLRARFDAEATLAAIAQHRVRVLVVVPVMLQRILALPEAVRRRYDTSSIQIVASSGSALPGDLATQVMDSFGDVLYNLYGSTEAGWVSVATPADLRAAPATAGRPLPGTELLIADDAGTPLPPGVPGRILTRTAVQLASHATAPGGFVDTGDVGHLDQAGRLFVDGRRDDMIVSGGENVYPQEVEDLLARHPAIADVAVVGVPDDRFGQQLRALVVLRPGHRLTRQDVRAYVRDHLARTKVPRDVIFCDELPRTPTGKVYRRGPLASPSTAPS